MWTHYTIFPAAPKNCSVRAPLRGAYRDPRRGSNEAPGLANFCGWPHALGGIRSALRAGLPTRLLPPRPLRGTAHAAMCSRTGLGSDGFIKMAVRLRGGQRVLYLKLRLGIRRSGQGCGQAVRQARGLRSSPSACPSACPSTEPPKGGCPRHRKELRRDRPETRIKPWPLFQNR